MKVMKRYGKALGQCMNFHKFSLLFGKLNSATVYQIKTLKNTLGIQNESGMRFYYRILEDINGSKCKMFAFIKEKLQSLVNGWTMRWLWKDGKD